MARREILNADQDESVSPNGPVEAREDLEMDTETREEQEEEKAKVARVEHMPTKEEYDEHMVTHWPYRSWCPHCIRGKGKTEYHKAANGRENKYPVISVDYAWTNQEKKGKPILVIKDSRSGKVGAHLVEKKGENTHAIRMLSSELRRLGYGKIIFKSDQEASIVALKNAVRREIWPEMSIVM